jgi:hypothetical protein
MISNYNATILKMVFQNPHSHPLKGLSALVIGLHGLDLAIPEHALLPIDSLPLPGHFQNPNSA